MNISRFAQGNETFKKSYFKKHEKELLTLAKMGQQPNTLFIGCSDSRVIPDLIIQSKPGDLFVLRNVGNFVPPFKSDEDFHATAAGIEYAVGVLKVEEVIICGHSHCGACKALYTDHDQSEDMIHTRKWLELGQKAKTMASLSLGKEAPSEELLRLTERLSIITQIENLLTYPLVQKRVQSGQLFIHGWYYDIETGTIDYYDPDSYEFLPLADLLE